MTKQFNKIGLFVSRYNANFFSLCLIVVISVCMPVVAMQEDAAEEISEEVVNKAPTINRSKLDIIAPIDEKIQKEHDLKHYLSSESVQPLLAGPDEHITLINTNSAENHKGVMILLPDWQQQATSPKAFNYLREALPKKGWTVISILPPNKPESYPSIALGNSAQLEDNQKTLAEYQQKLATILTAVTEKAKNYPGIIVVIAEGHHAALLPSIYQQNLVEQPMALISLSGHLNDEANSMLSAQHLSEIDLPVLDLYLKTDSRLIKNNVKLRKKMVNQALKSNFRQRELFNIQTGYYPKTGLVKEIIGWLKSIGW